MKKLMMSFILSFSLACLVEQSVVAQPATFEAYMAQAQANKDAYLLANPRTQGEALDAMKANSGALKSELYGKSGGDTGERTAFSEPKNVTKKFVKSDTWVEACFAAPEICIPVLITAAVVLTVVVCGAEDYSKDGSEWQTYVDEGDGVCLSALKSV